MLAETLIRQALFGESRGVGILRTFHRQYADRFANTQLERQLLSQIADESRHAVSYARLLAAREGGEVGPAGVAAGWQTVVRHISSASSFSTTLIGLYGLMEPFNLLSLQTLLPLLDKTELAEVNQIEKDEASHIGMFDLFAELVDRRVLSVNEAEGMEMIRVFIEALKDGIELPDGEPVTLPRSDWRAFMKQVGQLRGRLRSWSAAGECAHA